MPEETKVLHLEEQVELELQRKQVECQHSYHFQGDIGNYQSYVCSKCSKVYWVRHNNPNKT